jgi:GTP pyrophosphokinase
LKQVLENGDKVEIITSKIQKPKMDWLNFVVTTKAKNKIKRALKEEQFLEAEKGNEILRRKFKNWKIPFIDENIDRLIKKYKLSSSIDLYGLINQEKIDLIEIKRFLTGVPEKLEEGKEVPGKEAKPAKASKAGQQEPDDVLFIDRNLRKVNYKLAKCCNPEPGDQVFGFVTISRGISIHRQNCPNAGLLLTRYGYRKIDVQWKDTGEKGEFKANIRVTGTDRIGIMNEISQIISNDLKFNIVSIKAEAKKGAFTGIFRLSVKNNGSIADMIQKISQVGGVSKVVKID